MYAFNVADPSFHRLWMEKRNYELFTKTWKHLRFPQGLRVFQSMKSPMKDLSSENMLCLFLSCPNLVQLQTFWLIATFWIRVPLPLWSTMRALRISKIEDHLDVSFGSVGINF